MTVVCRSVTVQTAEKLSAKEKSELEKTIKLYNFEVEDGKDVKYFLNGREIPVTFVKVQPNPCRIGRETDTRIFTEEEVIEKYNPKIASIGDMLKRAGCELVYKDRKSGEFYFCNGTIWNVKPYKGGVYIGRLDELKL